MFTSVSSVAEDPGTSTDEVLRNSWAGNHSESSSGSIVAENLSSLMTRWGWLIGREWKLFGLLCEKWSANSLATKINYTEFSSCLEKNLSRKKPHTAAYVLYILIQILTLNTFLPLTCIPFNANEVNFGRLVSKAIWIAVKQTARNSYEASRCVPCCRCNLSENVICNTLIKASG